MSRSSRAGFSLLEVMLASGILLGCVIVLSQLAGLGRRHANNAEDMAKAQYLCQNKMNEMLAGMDAIDPADNEAIEDAPGWLFSVAIEPLSQPGLVAVRVTVSQEVEEGQTGREFTLVRWVRDPELQAAAREQAAAAAGETEAAP
jgi:Tfp pilus assembly protein PilV